MKRHTLMIRRLVLAGTTLALAGGCATRPSTPGDVSSDGDSRQAFWNPATKSDESDAAAHAAYVERVREGHRAWAARESESKSDREWRALRELQDLEVGDYFVGTAILADDITTIKRQDGEWTVWRYSIGGSGGPHFRITTDAAENIISIVSN